MSESCPVVKIEADNDQGFIIINESDFDKDTDTRYEDKKVPIKSSKKSAKKSS